MVPADALATCHAQVGGQSFSSFALTFVLYRVLQVKTNVRNLRNKEMHGACFSLAPRAAGSLRVKNLPVQFSKKTTKFAGGRSRRWPSSQWLLEVAFLVPEQLATSSVDRVWSGVTDIREPCWMSHPEDFAQHVIKGHWMVTPLFPINRRYPDAQVC